MSREPLQAAIFDRDGVLTYFDQEAAMTYFRRLVPIGIPELARRWQQWGLQVGFPASVEAEVVFWQGYWEQLCTDLGLDATVRTELQAFDYTTVVRAYPDARPALLHARSCGLRIGVLSNFSLATLDASLHAAGLADLIDVVCAAPVIGVSKPEPAAYHAVLSGLGVDAASAIFFDDEVPCVSGARAVGLRAYQVDRSSVDHDPAAGIIRDLTALTALLA